MPPCKFKMTFLLRPHDPSGVPASARHYVPNSVPRKCGERQSGSSPEAPSVRVKFPVNFDEELDHEVWTDVARAPSVHEAGPVDMVARSPPRPKIKT